MPFTCENCAAQTNRVIYHRDYDGRMLMLCAVCTEKKENERKKV